MNEQSIPVKESMPPPGKMDSVKGFVAKIKQILAPFWSKFTQTKFYTNKKIFYPVIIMFGLLFLTIIIGLIFGKPSQKSSTSPFATSTPGTGQGLTTPTPGSDPLSQIEQKLFDLKAQIDSFDVKQSRLQPPAVDFKISF